MLLYVVSVIIVTFGLSATGKSLPVTTCKLDATDNSECLKRAIKEAWPRFIKGLPELDFPPVDPLFYERGRLFINLGDMYGELIVSNATVIGFSKANFLNAMTHYSDDIFHLEIDVLIPKLSLKGAAKANGTLSVFKIVHEGYFNFTSDDVKALWDLTGHVVNDTFIVENFRMLPLLGKTKLEFNDLLESNQPLVDIVLPFINEYWPVLYRRGLPFLADAWEPFLIDIGNKFFSKVSFSEVFPKN